MWERKRAARDFTHWGDTGNYRKNTQFQKSLPQLLMTARTRLNGTPEAALQPTVKQFQAGWKTR